MSVATMTEVSPPAPAKARRAPKIDSAVFGMLVFVVVEAMFFSGLVSAFTISKAQTMPILWPPPDQPRLPASETLVNTIVLAVSGLLGIWARMRFARAGASAAKAPTLAAFALGAAFLVLQGAEWVRLIAQGMTLKSSQLSSFFYLIVGSHALHVAVGLLVLGLAYAKLRRGALRQGALDAAIILWTFVVGLWPILYARVYF